MGCPSLQRQSGDIASSAKRIKHAKPIRSTLDPHALAVTTRLRTACAMAKVSHGQLADALGSQAHKWLSLTESATIPTNRLEALRDALPRLWASYVQLCSSTLDVAPVRCLRAAPVDTMAHLGRYCSELTKALANDSKVDASEARKVLPELRRTIDGLQRQLVAIEKEVANG